ncbi:ring finger protein-like [Ambystoma mexicanum]|uniref:ring finger protein-like n=1 Tax=Ambystoma mexicanum TaxID=8296 RepID=UPI0037E81A66
MNHRGSIKSNERSGPENPVGKVGECPVFMGDAETGAELATSPTICPDRDTVVQQIKPGIMAILVDTRPACQEPSLAPHNAEYDTEDTLLGEEAVMGDHSSKLGERSLTSEENGGLGLGLLKWTTAKPLNCSDGNNNGEPLLARVPDGTLCQAPDKVLEESSPIAVFAPSVEESVFSAVGASSLEEMESSSVLCSAKEEKESSSLLYSSVEEKAHSSELCLLEERGSSPVLCPLVGGKAPVDSASPYEEGCMEVPLTHRDADPVASASGISMEEDEVEHQECPICTEPYDAGRRRQALLNCSHVVCDSCVQAIMDQASQAEVGRLRCPLCRQKTPMMKWEIRKLQEEMLERDCTRLQIFRAPPVVLQRRPGPWGALEYSFQQRFRTSRTFSCIPCLHYPLCFIECLNKLERRHRCCYLFVLALLYCAEKLCFLLPFLPIMMLILIIAFDK